MGDLLNRPGVEAVDYDYIVQVDPLEITESESATAPVAVNDPYASYQWHLPAIQADDAWDSSTGEEVVVAVVDSGISRGGEDLDCHVFVSPYNAIDATTGAAAANDDNGHGTHVAGTVAQCTNNGIGVAGVAFDAALMPIKVLDSGGSGLMSSVARGIDWARQHGADVINLSLGCSCSSAMVDEAIDAAVAQGIVVVAASGNDNSSAVSYPASHPDVIAVGATNYRNQRAPYSNQGSALDLVAPGGDNTEDANGDGYVDGVLQETFESGVWGYYFFQGTSMATPHVSGAVALLKSLEPGLDTVSARSILEATALDLGTPGFDTEYGHGLIQVADALAALTTSDDTPPVWPEGAELMAEIIAGGKVSLSWPEASDDVSVASYLVYRDGAQVATTGAATTTLVTPLASSVDQRFDVRAVDLAGNMGPPLSLELTAPDFSAPTWSSDAEIVVEEYGERQLQLSWTGAQDDVAVTGYRVRVAGTGGIATSGPAATISGLEPGHSYLFEVLARDSAGNWSEVLGKTLRTSQTFTDAEGHLFHGDIMWMSGRDITRGCNPPANDLFCPDDPLTRAQMAAFLARALGLTRLDHPGFTDVPITSTFADDIGRLATEGITLGCNPPQNDSFCPDDPVTRAQLAAFLVRALDLGQGGHPGFVDVPSSSTFLEDIDRLATAGITRGCDPPANDRFCPDDEVTRGQLAAFLRRGLGG